MFHVFAHAEFKNGIDDDSYESQFKALVQLWKRAHKDKIKEKEDKIEEKEDKIKEKEKRDAEDAELEALSYFTGDGWLWKEKHAWKHIIDTEWLLLEDVVVWLKKLTGKSDNLKKSLLVYSALGQQPLSYRDIMNKRIKAFTDYWKNFWSTYNFWHIYFTQTIKNYTNRFDWQMELNDDDWKGSPFYYADYKSYANYKDGEVLYEYVKEQFDIIVNPHSDEQLQKIFEEAFPKIRANIQKVYYTSYKSHIDTIKKKWEIMAVEEGYIE